MQSDGQGLTVATYHGDDLILQSLVQGYKAEVEREVKLAAMLDNGILRIMWYIIGSQRTEETRRRTERVCWARVMVKADEIEGCNITKENSFEINRLECLTQLTAEYK